jgi:alcohol dehydrogenase class IV
MLEFFEFALNARIAYKTGMAREIDSEIQRLGGSKVMIVADKGVVQAGLLRPIMAGLDGAVEVVGVFDEVPANSSVAVVERAAALAGECGADMLVAVGGGSPIDTAKCMRILMKYGGELLDYQGYNILEEALVPMLAIPTTAGTGSEVTNWAVILDEEQDLKIAFSSPFLVPEVAVLDPEMTRTLPPRITAATGLDALTHAIESYVSSDSNPLSDALALYAIESIQRHLRTAVKNGADMEARSAMLIASCMAGVAFNNGFVGAVHALAHTIGGKYHVHHGTANAIFLPHVMHFNREARADHFVRIAAAMGVKVAEMSRDSAIDAGIEAVRSLMEDCGLPMRLRDVDVPEDSLAEIAEISLTDTAIFTNPRPATEEDLLEIVKNAY